MAQTISERIVNAVRRATLVMRMKRTRKFLEIMKPGPQEVVLDVGGYHEMWRQSGYEGPLVCLNLETPERYKIFGQLPGNCRYVQGDARSLELPDQSFDIVFSNSVIEHVGTWEDQHAFARETARVGKRYWIQTPNKHFPIEPHMNFPYFQFLPRALQERLALVWPLSYPRRDGYRGEEMKSVVRSIRLLTIKEMRELYPTGVLWQERFGPLVKSIVMYRR